MMKQQFRIGVGTVSLLNIVVVFLFAIVAVLALVSARADGRLTEKTMETTAAYYQAEGAVQKKLAEIDASLQRGEDPSAQIEGVTKTTDRYLLLESMGNGNSLLVEFIEEGLTYRIVRYYVKAAENWQPQDEPALWDGQ